MVFFVFRQQLKIDILRNISCDVSRNVLTDTLKYFHHFVKFKFLDDFLINYISITYSTILNLNLSSLIYL